MGNKTAQAQDLASLKDVQESMVSDPAHVTAMLKQMFIAYDKDKSGILDNNGEILSFFGDVLNYASPVVKNFEFQYKFLSYLEETNATAFNLFSAVHNLEEQQFFHEMMKLADKDQDNKIKVQDFEGCIAFVLGVVIEFDKIKMNYLR